MTAARTGDPGTGPVVTIRDQAPHERAVVRDVTLRAFGERVVADLVDLLQDSPAGAPGLSFVAEVDGRVAGHTLLTRSWVDAPDRLVEVLVLSPLSVLPEFRRRGIGGRLVRHACARAADRGTWPLVFLEGSPVFYTRHGFQPARPLGFTPPSPRIPDPAFQVHRLPSHDPSIIGALVYADPFWALDCVGLRDR